MAVADAPSPTLIDVLRRELRARHMSLRTEDAYVYWVRGFIRFQGRRHPREMGAAVIEEVTAVLSRMQGKYGLLARLLHGTAMRRIIEALRLRVKDVDFDQLTLVVREGKGNRDRARMLPQSLVVELRAQRPAPAAATSFATAA